MKTVAEIVVCVLIVAIEIAVIVAILAPHVLRWLLPRRRPRGAARTH
jgi:hypothetical protein